VSIQKVRLVSKGFQQIHRINYDETFAPLENVDSIRFSLGIRVARGWKLIFFMLISQRIFIWSKHLDSYIIHLYCVDSKSRSMASSRLLENGIEIWNPSFSDRIILSDENLLQMSTC
jgi:hypothetical protein